MTLGKIRRSWRSALIPTAALIVQVTVPGLAQAQDDSDAAETGAARALAVDGVKLAQADQCGEAVEKLDRAEKLRHSAIVLAHLGQCQVKLGKWVEGSESLRKMLREPLPENPSPTLEQAYQKAAATLRELKPRIPSLKINVTAPREATISLRVDGQEVPSTVIGLALPVDPGDHVIEVSAPGYLRASGSAKLAAGGTASVQLELKRDPTAPEPALAATPAAPARQAPERLRDTREPTDTRPAERSSGAGKVLAYLSYGVGAAGLGVGIGFGAAASSAEKSLRTSCPNQVCPPDRADELSSAKTKGTISTIGFAAAGGGVLLGTVFLLTSSSGSHDTGTASPRVRTAQQGIRAHAKVGLGSVAIAGEF